MYTFRFFCTGHSNCEAADVVAKQETEDRSRVVITGWFDGNEM